MIKKRASAHAIDKQNSKQGHSWQTKSKHHHIITNTGVDFNSPRLCSEIQIFHKFQ